MGYALFWCAGGRRDEDGLRSRLRPGGGYGANCPPHTLPGGDRAGAAGLLPGQAPCGNGDRLLWPGRAGPPYGSILATPKTAWRGFPIAACFREALGVPVGFDTDVNAAALGEWAWGGAQGLDTAAYLTVGTGVGLGIVVGGRPYHGMLHPEGGHLPIARRADDPLARGICPFHPNCLEGLASGPSIEARWGRPARELAGQGAVWELEAFYLAQALCAYIMVLSPERIILGGGVMRQAQLFPLIRAEVRRQLGGYISGGNLAELEQYIVPASLGDSQGVLGAAQLVADAYKENGGRV